MALKIKYHYRGHPRLIGFANDKYHDIYEAMAAAEGVDLRQFLAMEKQIAALNAERLLAGAASSSGGSRARFWPRR